MSEMPGWYEALRDYTKGMPQIDDFPQVDSPDEPPPSATESIKDMPEDMLGYNYQLIAKWQALAELNEGIYAAAEAALHQQYNAIKRQAHKRIKAEQPNGKFTNAAEAAILVESDPEVEHAEKKWNAMKQGHVLFRAYANAYGKYALTYAGERKDRREREARRAMQAGSYYND